VVSHFVAYTTIWEAKQDQVKSNRFAGVRGDCGESIPQQNAKRAVEKAMKAFDLAA
jgi:hypothetical protein